MRKSFIAALTLALGMFARSGHAVAINFDEDSLDHLDDITGFYAALGVTFGGISNPFPIGPGPFPAPATVPATLGGAAIWDPGGGIAPGESAPNFAVGLGQGQPGDAGILMTFAFDISSLSLVGLDFGSGFGDSEEMTLTAYDAAGNRIGQQHFTTQFIDGAIAGSISFAGMRYVAFNYTNTQFGFYGIDDLVFEPAVVAGVPEPSAVLLLGGGMLAFAILRKARTGR
jgi:PEP-CTERM motif-containing protein